MNTWKLLTAAEFEKLTVEIRLDNKHDRMG